MRILVLSHYFPPEVNAPANRTHEHAKTWVRDGHEVTVLTNVPNHPKGVVFADHRNALFQESWVDGIRVLRSWTYVTPNEGFAKRTLNYLTFACAAIFLSFRSGEQDVVLATSPQFFCGMAGAIVARLKRIPFVLEVRDLWPESIVQLGQLSNRRLVWVLEKLETWLYREAQGIVAVTEAFADHIQLHGIPRDRIAIIYNGIDIDRFRPIPADKQLLRRAGVEGEFVVAYIGTLGIAHGLDTALEAAESFRDQSVAFLFVGDGADRARLVRERDRRGLSNVTFVGLRPREEIPYWIASVDCLLVMLRDLRVFETVIPSKIFEFLAQERPVVLAAKGEIRRLVLQANAGLVVDPESPEQLVRAIRAVSADPQGARERAAAGREWVQRRFRRDQLARALVRFVQDVVSEGR